MIGEEPLAHSADGIGADHARITITDTLVAMPTDPQRGRWLSYENQMVAVLASAGGVAALDAQAVFYLMPFIAADFALSNRQIGIIGSAVLVGWAIGGLVIARLSDRAGKRKPFLIGAFVCFAVLSGLSAAARGFASMLLARLVMGIAEGPVIPVKQAMVIAESSPNRRGLNMGIVQNFGAQFLGTLVGPLLLVAVAQHFGWRFAFLVAGLPGLLIAMLIWRVLREPPVSRDAADTTMQADGSRSGTQRLSWLRLAGIHNMIVCTLIALVSVAWFFMLLTFLPLYLVRDMHDSPGTMSVIMSLIGLAGVTSAILVPYISDRKGRRAAILGFTSLGAIAPLGMVFAGGNPWVAGAMLVVGCQMLGILPLVMSTVPQESVSFEDRATATSLVIAVAQIGGGVVGPLAGGWLAERWGNGAPLLLAAGLAVAAALLAPLLRETRPSAPRRA